MARRTLVAGLALGAIALPAAAAQAAPAKRCDPIGGGACLLPFPNDYFTKHDRKTATGLRLNLSRAAMPANKARVHIDPTDRNRSDGFSPGQQITVPIPKLDAARAGSSRSRTSARASPSASRSC